MRSPGRLEKARSLDGLWELMDVINADNLALLFKLPDDLLLAETAVQGFTIFFFPGDGRWCPGVAPVPYKRSPPGSDAQSLC